MAKNKSSKKGRPNIPDSVRMQVWTEAAGRCQFRGCHTELWYDGLTWAQRNFGKMAHIIGASKDGPRGNDESEALAQDPSNIMLLCRKHHDLVDSNEHKADFPAELLYEMKEEHILRVKRLLGTKAVAWRPLIVKASIGKAISPLDETGIKSALLPNYSDVPSAEWSIVDIGSFDRSKTEHWLVAIDRINGETASINKAIENGKLERVAVFALAAQPLLMWLGRQLGDKTLVRVFEPMRTNDPEAKWAWEPETGENIDYKCERLLEGEGLEVILLIALSDNLGHDKYHGMVSGDPHVYQMTIDNPVQGFLRKKSDQAGFVSTTRALLNRIQRDVGKDCLIHVLPAMPASLAVEFGRLIQPTKDPSIFVYEYFPRQGPKKVVELLNQSDR